MRSIHHPLRFKRARGMEFSPERGDRCSMCFDMRFEKTAEYAAGNGFTVCSAICWWFVAVCFCAGSPLAACLRCEWVGEFSACGDDISGNSISLPRTPQAGGKTQSKSTAAESHQLQSKYARVALIDWLSHFTVLGSTMQHRPARKPVSCRR